MGEPFREGMHGIFIVPIYGHVPVLSWSVLKYFLEAYSLVVYSSSYFDKDGELPDQFCVLGLEVVGGLVAFYCDQWRK